MRRWVFGVVVGWCLAAGALLAAAPNARALTFAQVTSSTWGTGEFASCTGAYPAVFGGGAGYVVVQDSGAVSCSDTLTSAQFAEQEQQLLASTDEATGTAVQSDIASSDAAAGSNFWDGLASEYGIGDINPGQLSLFDEAGGFLEASGTWPLASALPGVYALGAIGATAYLGWSIGSALSGPVLSFLGIDGGGTTQPGGGSVNETFSHLQLVPAGTNLDCGAVGCSTVSGGCGSCNIGPPISWVTPKLGWLAVWSVTGGALNDYNDEVTGNYPNAGADPLPKGFGGSLTQAEILSKQTGCDWVQIDQYNWAGSGSSFQFLSPSSVMWCPAVLHSLPGPNQNTPTLVTDLQSGLATPTESQAKTNIGQCMTGTVPVTSGGDFNSACSGFMDQVCTSTAMVCHGYTSTTMPGTSTVTLPPISPNETFAQYSAALRAAGLLGTITQATLSDINADPSVAPDDVVRTSPQAGTQVAPSTDDTVYTNPDSVPSLTGGPPVGPSPPGITLPQASTPCNVFPFGIPCWLTNQLGEFVSATPTAPSFAIGTPALFGGGNLTVNLDHPFGADLSAIMDVVRVVLLVLSFVGIVMWLGGLALGGSTSGGGDESD